MSQRSNSALGRAGFLSLHGDSRSILWLKASASESSGCVEVASTGASIYIQDSKSPDGGTVIALSPSEWSVLVADVRSGRVDLPAR
ncbi:DUF397 domain-containing protein [Actinomadura sp. 9N407]|uniref:DUF397 domain-containing protein n=1 Tax=Actinomadura sp. 9N407 TaxID=3375154 RepID=UPI003798764C